MAITQGKGTRAPNILIVEDDAGVASLECKCLQLADYNVITAGSAGEALESLKRQEVALVVLDYRLPGDVDGLAFYRQMKEAGYDLPVILVTGFSSEATLIQALRLGVRDFVPKSMAYLDYLPEAVKRVLRQVQTEQKLAESEARLAGIIASAKDAILVAEADQSITLFNQAAEKMFRCSAEQALGQPINHFIRRELPEGPRPVEGQKEEDVGTLTMRIRSGSRGVRADGSEFPIEVSMLRLKLSGGTLYTVLVRDITERRRVEEAQAQLIAILEATPDLVAISQVEGRTSYINTAGRKMLGLGLTEQISLVDFRPEDARRLILDQAIPAAIRDGVWSGETVLRGGGGEEIPVSQVLIAHKGPSGEVEFLSTIARDIRGQQRLEEQLRQSQKMEAIGQLAGGVAHDFNNLLTIISGYSEMLLSNMVPPESMRELVQEIRDAGDRAASLTRQLLAFSRKQVLEPKVLGLNPLVRNSEKMLRRLIGEDIHLSTVLVPALAPVKVDPGQIEQVLLNLAVNARDAMPQGGKLTVETANVTQGEAPNDPEMPPGNYVMLAVSDTGCGMDQATQARIFEPFFTTKGAGEGTGLGLATVFGIVKQSGGHIRLYSEPGRGTTFQLYFPVVDEAAAKDKTLTAIPRPPTGNETILLVEDEDVVRTLARHTLQMLGYTVLEATRGSEALRLSETYAGPIHLVVSDVVMPGMSGREMTEQIAPARPGIRVLYLSGYTSDAIVRHGILQAEVAFLQKPFAPTALAQKVREVLDGLACST